MLMGGSDEEAAKGRAKAMIDEGKALLDALDGAEAIVFARYYAAAAEFYKVRVAAIPPQGCAARGTRTHRRHQERACRSCP